LIHARLIPPLKPRRELRLFLPEISLLGTRNSSRKRRRRRRKRED
jgi:hypothetical protein